MDTSEISDRITSFDQENKSEREHGNIEHLKMFVERISEEEIEDVATAILETAKFIKESNCDYVVFTGSSRLLLKSLFMGLDTGNAKVLDFNVDENRRVYGRNIFEPTVDKIQSKEFYVERASNMSSILESKGVTIDGAKIMVVDDHVSNGYKAREYLNIMKEISGLSDYKYTVPLANDNEYLRNIVGDIEHFSIIRNTEKIYGLLGLLSDALRVTDNNRNKVTEELYSKSGEALFRNTVRDIIKAIRKQILKQGTP